MKIVLNMKKINLYLTLHGEKWLVFFDELDSSIKNHPRPTTIYFRGIEAERDFLIGEATVLDVYNLHYNDNFEKSIELQEQRNELTLSRYRAVKLLYLNWCALKSIKPNYNEGWFKSKKFMAYMDLIGWGANYAIFLDNIIKYDRPKNISDISNQDNLIEITETQALLESISELKSQLQVGN